MSEYVRVEAEPTDDEHVMELWVNQLLTNADEEVYADYDAGENGTPIAQLLFIDLDGIDALTIRPDHLIIRRDPQYEWEFIIDEVRDALRDFFL